jgi:hypothetical protein
MEVSGWLFHYLCESCCTQRLFAEDGLFLFDHVSACVNIDFITENKMSVSCDVY